MVIKEGSRALSSFPSRLPTPDQHVEAPSRGSSSTSDSSSSKKTEGTGRRDINMLDFLLAAAIRPGSKTRKDKQSSSALNPATAIMSGRPSRARRGEEEGRDRPRITRMTNEPRRKKLTTLKKRILAVSL